MLRADFQLFNKPGWYCKVRTKKTPIMKKLLHPLGLCIALLLATTIHLGAQTMTGTVLNQPCNNNGQIGVTVTGLTPPISYVYSNQAANQTITHSGVGSLTNSATGLGAYQGVWSWFNVNVWTVSASDGTNTASMTLTLNPAFSADSISVSPAVCPASASLQVQSFSGGTAPFTCVWTNTASSISYTGNPAAVPNGFYTFVITDAMGCMITSVPTGSFNGIYVMNQSNIVVSMSGSAANCTNGTAVANPSGGTAPYTYLWSNGATTQSISGLSQGQYNCIVTDAIGCSSIGYYYVQQSITINYNNSITNATCLQNNGSVISFVSGGTAPYSFLWSNGATTQNISGLAGGFYNLQITDANGCTGYGSAFINATTPINVTYNTAPSSCTAATGAATVNPTGGTAPYTIVWNTFPTTTSGPSISGMPGGNYSFLITDANGCIRTGIVTIPLVSTISAFISGGSPVCPATTGFLGVNVSGSNAPFTYLWSNAATTGIITGIPTGAYSCTITDAVGCTVVKSMYLSQISPVTVGFNVTPASCRYATDGSIAANATGGTAPYTYLWNNSQTSATATALGTGYYSVIVTDANGCKAPYNISNTFVSYNAANNSCYCTITGTVYADANSNCVKNSGELGIPNIQVHCTGFGYAYTNTNGVYSFQVPTGTYTITETVQQIYPLASCQSNNQVVAVTAATNCVSQVDFANNVVPISDLHIITANMNWPVPGNNYQQKVIVQNDGSVVESSVKLGYTHDGQLGFVNCTPWALTQQNAISYPNWYSITTGFTSLNPGASSTAFINYNVPTNIPLSTAVNFQDSVANSAPISTSWLTDNTPWNNVDDHTTYVIGSYDPNFKEVSPQGTGPQGFITYSDSSLTYVIHFQNTGTYYAQNIVVVDTLDSDLMLSSMRPGYSDHNYTTTMSDNGVVKFTFSNINLPWQSAYGDMMSSGMVTYSVKLKKNLAMGTQIKNQAAIYFDYNDPIITNTTLNTLAAVIPTSVKENKKLSADGVLLFPNPARERFTLAFASKEAGRGTLSIMDISGREVSVSDVQIQEGENHLSSSTSQLQNGIYLVQLKTGKETVTKKMIVSK